MLLKMYKQKQGTAITDSTFYGEAWILVHVRGQETRRKAKNAISQCLSVLDATTHVQGQGARRQTSSTQNLLLHVGHGQRDPSHVSGLVWSGRDANHIGRQ